MHWCRLLYILGFIFIFTYAQETTEANYNGGHPCYNTSVINSTYDRTFSFYYDYYDYSSTIDQCESVNLVAGWYRYEDYSNIPTVPAAYTQCGSPSPIWLNGSYPTNYGETTTMMACKTGLSTNCDDSYSVTAMSCGSYNIVYLEPVGFCGRYCMEGTNFNGTEQTTHFPQYDSECFGASLVNSSYSRSVNYTLQAGEPDECESSIAYPGWYYFMGGQNIATEAVQPGQCGSMHPIYVQGSYPTVPGEYATMTACLVGNNGCDERWNITVKNCYGTNMAYLVPTTACGRYCIDSYNPSRSTIEAFLNVTLDTFPTLLVEACSTNHALDSKNSRLADYTKWNGEFERCESPLLNGWYRYEYLQNLVMEPVSSGQCGSSSPIYFEGTLPKDLYANATITACLVNTDGSCKERWDIQVVNCSIYMAFNLRPTTSCGRYCMASNQSQISTTPSNSTTDPCYTTNFANGDYTRSPNYTLVPGEMETCESNSTEEDWYMFETMKNVPDYAVYSGQCGSTRPIYFQGTYPKNYGEETTMKACLVGPYTYSGYCDEEWDVKVRHCYGYNVAYLKPSNNCGRYCMNQTEFTSTPSSNWTTDPCYTTHVVTGDYTRSPNHTLAPGEMETCESNSTEEDWYMFETMKNVPDYAVNSGQCGATRPIYFQGTYPTNYGEETTMKACLVGPYTYPGYCDEEWNVKVRHCYGYNVAYLKPSNNCGRYCMNQTEFTSTPSSNWTTDPCYTTHVVTGDYTRSPNHTLAPGEMETCESNSTEEDWYMFETMKNVPDYAVNSGQCGATRPIYFQGTYPTNYGEETTMKACLVGPYTYPGYCDEEWNVKVRHCYGYNVAYLKPSNNCGRYCMNQTEFTSTPSSNWTTDPCYTTHVVTGDYTRSPNHTLAPGEMETCESNSTVEDWYMFETMKNVPDYAVNSGQCGATRPIYFQGTYPTNYGEETTMKACLVGPYTYPGYCDEEWNVKVRHCYGYNVAYLKPSNNCGRYCMNQTEFTSTPSSNWTTDPCYTTHVVTGDYTRSPNHTLAPGEMETCESNSTVEDWYMFETMKNVPDYAVNSGQCGATRPIYFQGTYPKNYGEETTMKACLVGPYTYPGYCDEEWNVKVRHCYGYNVAYLKPSNNCGRYCMNQTEFTSTPSSNWTTDPCYTTHVVTGDYTRSPNHTLAPGEMETCESNSTVEDWYMFETMKNVPDYAVNSGQCGATRPIYFQGTYPKNYGEETTMKACLVGPYTYPGYCDEEWNVKVRHCYGYNVAYLKPSNNCGRYCMNQTEFTSTPSSNWTTDPCYTTHVVTGDYTRSPNHTLAPGEMETCESNSTEEDWYMFETMKNVPDYAVNSGQCGATRPIYFQGTYPTNYGEETTMKACLVGPYTYSGYCDEEWDVKVRHCYGYNVAYLKPSNNCGRYCMNQTEFTSTPSSNWTTDPCYTTHVVTGDYTRSPNHTLAPGEMQTCESNSTVEDWYMFETMKNVPNYAVNSGQCGATRPIYFQGTYPTNYGEETTMKACLVGPYTYSGYCDEEWDVKVRHCYGYNVAYLKPSNNCGRYCMNQTEFTSTPSSNWTTDPCYTTHVVTGDYTRSPNHTLAPGEMETCESNSTVEDWYMFETMKNVPDYAVNSGQCGATRPIYFQGTYPTNYGEETTMKACLVGPYTYSGYCDEEWDVKVRHCYGYNVAYLKPSNNCGRYCMNQTEFTSTPSSNWTTDPCYTTHVVTGDYTRSPNHTLAPGEMQTCESNSTVEDWYMFETMKNVPDYAVNSGQCGATRPIYFQGTYPTNYGEETTMKACLVGPYTYSGYCDEEWDVKVRHCYGYNVAYLKPSNNCGRYCMNQTEFTSTPSSNWTTDPCYTTHVVTGDYTRSPNHTLAPGEMQTCESNSTVEDWYMFETMKNVPNYAVNSGQCGATRPIYFQGTYPTNYGEETTMKACLVGPYTYSGYCDEEWDVKVRHCYGYNVAYLKPSNNCGRYCMNQTEFTSTPSSNWTTDPCYTTHVVTGDYTRSPNHTLAPGEMQTCESNSTVEDWYMFETMKNVPNYAVNSGQCGATRPIYFQGTYPTNYGEETTMKACLVGPYTYSGYCDEEWDVKVRHCYGYNVAYLKPSNNCGRYCMNQTEFTSTPSSNWTTDPCYTTHVVTGDYTRSPNHTLAPGEMQTCESNSTVEDWYMFETMKNVPDYAVNSGQCGATRPIYFQGTYPKNYGEETTMKACLVGPYTYSGYCDEEWDVKVRHCYGYNVAYLKPSNNCGRYCMNQTELTSTPSSNWTTDPCYTTHVVTGDYTRSPNHTLAPGEMETCESNSTEEDWYMFETMKNVPDYAVNSGQCGATRPIYFQGAYPKNYGEETTMKACLVGPYTYSGYCDEEWDVKVRHCYGYNVAYLKPSNNCGRYCMNQTEFTSPPSSNWTTDPCYTTNVVTGDYTRSPNHTLAPGEMETCESNSTEEDWYMFETMKNVPDYAVNAGQCGSTHPIYFQGTYPKNYGEETTMKACLVGPYTYSGYCDEEWDVKVRHCYGYNVAYLKPSNNCGRYCMNQTEFTSTPSSNWTTDPCYTTHVVTGDYTRSPNHTLAPGEMETCESNSTEEDWYMFETMKNVPDYAVNSGQCGATRPIYFQGTYPKNYGEETTMKACLVGPYTYSGYCDEEWDVKVRHCYGYNVAYLKPSNNCGRYCMNQTEFTSTPSSNWTTDPCYTTNVVTGDYTRSPNHTLAPGEMETCESNSTEEDWYMFETMKNVPDYAVNAGQCGSTHPIYFQGTYPKNYGEKTTMKACLVGPYTYSGYCDEEWDVKVRHCYGYNVAYLKPSNNCGRYCMNQTEFTSTPSSNWTTDPCYTTHVVTGDYTRSPNHTLAPGEMETCESNSTEEDWYMFETMKNVPDYAVNSGQCGATRPIYFQGTYPKNYGEETTMKACLVGPYTYSGYCDEEWDVKVRHCYGYNVAYLKPSNNCGRYCMNQTEFTSTPSSNWTTDPCYTTNVVTGDYTRSPNHTLAPGEMETCESNSTEEDWYMFETMKNVPDYAVNAGQCGSTHPIYFQGTYPKNYGEETTMKACLVGPYTYSGYCDEEWDVKVRHCYGYNVAYLKPSNNCGRYCMNQTEFTSTPSSNWTTDPCYTTHVVTGDYTRSPNHTLAPGEMETCESNSTEEDWYMFETMKNVPDYAVNSGQCGATRPIYFQGTYPKNYGEETTMKACLVGPYTYSGYCDEEWDVKVRHCYGYNVAYLKPSNNCGRYCMNQTEFTSTPSSNWTTDPCYTTNVVTGDYTRSPNHTLAPGEMETCESNSTEEDWYMFETMKNVPDYAVNAGQCGSTHPIYFQGTYPKNYGEETTMKACLVGPYTYSGYCDEEWDVKVRHCYGYNVAYLKPSNNCGRYCMNSSLDSFPNPTPSYHYDMSLDSNAPSDYFTMSDRLWSTSPSNAPEMRTPEYTLLPSITTTEMYPHTGMTSQSQSSHPMMTSQPQSSPLMMTSQSQSSHLMMTSQLQSSHLMMTSQLQSSHPTMTSQSQSMVPSRTSDTIGATSGYDASTSTSYPQSDVCLTSNAIYSDVTRQPSYTLSPLDSDMCESSNVTEGWYRFEGGQNVPLTPVSAGQCGSNSPIYFQGQYPTTNGERRNMTACLIKDGVTGCFETWNVTVMQCNGYNVAYLKSSQSCGRYCMDVDSRSILPSVHSTQFDIYPTASMDDSAIWTSYRSTDISSRSSSMTNMPTSSSVITMPTTSSGTTTPSTTPFADINLAEYISVSQYPVIPSHDANSANRQLMFQCSHYTHWNLDSSLLNNLFFDVLWEIDDVEIVIKSDLLLSDISTHGRINSSEWTSRSISIGFNIKCGIRLSLHQSFSNTSFVMSQWSYFVGMEVWPKTVDISSGESASVYVWMTVPIACSGTENVDSCKVVIEMVDFNEHYTSGAPRYCNESLTVITKPSLCGLELNGWRTPWTWQHLNIDLPENNAQDQEYTAKIQLRVGSATDDPMWLHYELPQIRVNVINENVTEDYWWWFGYCFTGTDPWFSTFDWQWYGFHDEGEFVLYRHKTKPIEVHTIQRRFESHHVWTEHCAIAIRAASDVFIIYGCGKPTKWIIRREGCNVGNEYLEVYSRWGGYEITLPTGSRVYVWIAMNRRINAYITLSRTDRYETEGLCGTWNQDYTDDFTGRDGRVYDDSTDFARTWSVPESDSLFIAKKRTEKLSQSFMYCSCIGGTLDNPSPNVDCSWKESLPVCPPLNFDKESCTVRSKRSTDTDDPDDESIIDVSPAMVAFTAKPKVSLDWKNGWTEATAIDACNSYFNESILFDACSSMSNVNVSSAIDNCVRNIQVAGTDEYKADAFELFKTQCTNEVRTNNTVWSETTDSGTNVADLITKNTCPFDCKYNGSQHGDCVEGKCACYSGYTGEDCRVNMEAPPSIATEVSEDSKCDTSARACEHFSVYGDNFYESSSLSCKVEKAELVDNEIVQNGTFSVTTGQLRNFGEVRCPRSNAKRRRKRSTSSSTTEYYLVSVSNNGVNYSDPVPVILYDSSCQTCTTTSSAVTCTIRSDVCIKDGFCYSTSSSECASDTSSDSSSKLWIIGVVIAVLMVIIIVIVLIKFCKKSRPIFPVCGHEQYDLPDYSADHPAVYDPPPFSGRNGAPGHSAEYPAVYDPPPFRDEAEKHQRPGTSFAESTHIDVLPMKGTW